MTSYHQPTIACVNVNQWSVVTCRGDRTICHNQRSTCPLANVSDAALTNQNVAFRAEERSHIARRSRRPDELRELRRKPGGMAGWLVIGFVYNLLGRPVDALDKVTDANVVDAAMGSIAAAYKDITRVRPSEDMLCKASDAHRARTPRRSANARCLTIGMDFTSRSCPSTSR
jgi:hypothetical protein